MNGTKNKRLAKVAPQPVEKPQQSLFCHKNCGLSKFSIFAKKGFFFC